MRRLALAWAGFATLAAAQTPTTFTSPDGSRFVLLPNPAMPLVHWAIATPADDPPRFPGLAFTTMRASLGGTWNTGSIDAARERRALDALDLAWHDWFANAGDPERVAQLAARKQEADELADRDAFRRVLAALPVHRPEVLDRAPFCLFVLTTTADALPDVAATLIDRRENQALRELQPLWTETSCLRDAAVAGDPASSLRAEVLALAIPDHPYVRHLERALPMLPQRADALATWQATQRPERTVHVLLGGFDPAVVRADLERAFATTALPAYSPPPGVAPRPITSLRRSAVTGLAVPTLAIAFVLPAAVEPHVLEATTRWLGGGADSWIGVALQKLGRKDATVRCAAPWPAAASGRGLLLIEVSDPSGIDRLADHVVTMCRDAGAAPPSKSSLQVVLAAMQRDRSEAANDPRRFVGDLAVLAATWPDRDLAAAAAADAEPSAVQQLLKTVFAGQPVIVEGRP